MGPRPDDFMEDFTGGLRWDLTRWFHVEWRPHDFTGLASGGTWEVLCNNWGIWWGHLYKTVLCLYQDGDCAQIVLQISALRALSETNWMIPKSTHLFSHWSIPLKQSESLFFYFINLIKICIQGWVGKDDVYIRREIWGRMAGLYVSSYNTCSLLLYTTHIEHSN